MHWDVNNTDVTRCVIKLENSNQSMANHLLAFPVSVVSLCFAHSTTGKHQLKRIIHVAIYATPLDWQVYFSVVN